MSLVRKSCQSVFRQLKRGAGQVLSGETSILPVMGKWSALAGHSSGFVLHLRKDGRRLELQKTLSGREKFPELDTWSVGSPAGSAISISYVSVRSMRKLAASMFAGMKRRVSAGLSHKGWWRLKSPSQTMSFLAAWPRRWVRCCQCVCKRVRVSECSQAL